MIDIIPGTKYTEYECGCIFLSEEDDKRKNRKTFSRDENKRGYTRIYCPEHKESPFKFRFVICPNCKKKRISMRFLKEGLCTPCIPKKIKIKPNKILSLQYGKQIPYIKDQETQAEPDCLNRIYCLSFFKNLPNGILDCTNCEHKKFEE